MSIFTKLGAGSNTQSIFKPSAGALNSVFLFLDWFLSQG